MSVAAEVTWPRPAGPLTLLGWIDGDTYGILAEEWRGTVVE